MSATANWSYTNTATILPRNEQQSSDGWGAPAGGYGEPYQIACTWVGGGDLMRASDGVEFTPSVRFYHEDKRVKDGDLIAKGVTDDIEKFSEIRAHIEYDMSPFGEEPDFMSVI